MNFSLRFHPRLIDSLHAYNKQRLFKDVMAGLTVGVVALPLAMAFAIASGTKPEAGIFAAIIGGFVVSALGGSPVQIGGPAGAFIVVIYGIIEKYGLPNLLISTVFAGMMLFAMGMLRLGSAIRLIPVPIVIGFTNGIAVLIGLSQLKDFFGLKIAKMPGDFFSQIHTLAMHASTVNIVALLMSAICLLLLFVWPKAYMLEKTHSWFRFSKAVPGPVVVLVLGTAAVALGNLPVETIGTRFGGIPQGFPSFQLPSFSWELVKQLFAPALTLALLGAVESLLCARVADNLTQERHDPNQELMAQGVANFIVPFFGALPVTGTIARTTTNVRSGATSPVAGIVHALVIAIVVLIAAPLAKNIPLAALAAILLYVAYNMGEWSEFRKLAHFSNNYRILVVGTFLLTVMVDLTTAVEVGLVLACVFFIYRISALTEVEPITAEALPQGVAAYSIFGSLFFGATSKLEALLDPKNIPEKVLILKMQQLISLDTTGLDALEAVHRAAQSRGAQFIICGVTRQPLSLMRRAGFIDHVGDENCVATLSDAIGRATAIAANANP